MITCYSHDNIKKSNINQVKSLIKKNMTEKEIEDRFLTLEKHLETHDQELKNISDQVRGLEERQNTIEQKLDTVLVRNETIVTMLEQNTIQTKSSKKNGLISAFFSFGGLVLSAFRFLGSII